MFAALARFTAQYKIPITIFWISLAFVLVFIAPSLAEVGVTDDTQFLPHDTESTQVQDLLQEKFAGDSAGPAGSALIVVHNPERLSPQDLQEARTFQDWLGAAEAPDEISAIISPLDNEALSSTLISQDKTTLLMRLELSEASASAPAREAMRTIREHIQAGPYSVQIYLTGSAGISGDILTSIQQTIDKATLVTIILVVFLLLLIYRSPVAMLVPLITIGASYLVARGIAGFIADSGVNVSSLVDAYLVVTLFGIGTDYCLFMVSRFKEELGQSERQEAGQMALRRIGPVILASAITVIVALLCLGISRFAMNRTSGFILAMGVTVTLLAGLTLTPALISIFGRKLLWPAKLRHNQRDASSIWSRIGGQITRRPVLLAVPLLVLLALPYLALPRINYSASMLDQMPQDIGSVRGYRVLQAQFPPGELNPLNLLVQSPGESWPQTGKLPELSSLAESLSSIEGVARVKYFAAPVSSLSAQSQESRDIAANLTLLTANRLSFFQDLGQSLKDLAVQYPGVQESANFQQAVVNLNLISAGAAQINPQAPGNIPKLLEQAKILASAIGDNLAGLAAEFNLQTESPFTQWLESTYFSEDGSLALVDIVLSTDPYSRESIATVERVREAVKQAAPASGLESAVTYVGGTSADQADILAVNDADFLRVLAVAVAGILLVTILLLRSLIAPVYMILTVLLNFGATLGISAWLFLEVLDQNTIIYMLPIFVFVILIAVGSDYNIFLVSRIREESHHRPVRDAICNAVANTGGVITSCGIILAGTFATLTSAPLQMVFQVGAAISIGVIIDTFLVRAILIPALASIFGRWNWWPSRLARENFGNSKAKNQKAKVQLP